MKNPQVWPHKNHRDLEDTSRYICTVPSHQDEYDNLGACLICRVPTINGLHPKARARLLAKRPDLAHAVPPLGGGDANDSEAGVPVTPTQTAPVSGSTNHRFLHWIDPTKQIVSDP